MEKTEFLVLYDYGMGGTWSVMSARSTAEITEKYPMLIPKTDKPEWMTPGLYDRIRAARSYDIDDEPTGWLHNMLKYETRSS